LLFLLFQAVLFVKVLNSFQGCQSVDFHGLFVPVFLTVVEAAWWIELSTSCLYGSELDFASQSCHGMFVRVGLIRVQLYAEAFVCARSKLDGSGVIVIDPEQLYRYYLLRVGGQIFHDFGSLCPSDGVDAHGCDVRRKCGPWCDFVAAALGVR